MPEDCLDLLVEATRGSVRDLEGVLIQLVATASLLKRRIDLELTQQAMHKLAPMPASRNLEPRAVIGVVAAFFGTRPEALAARSRRRDVLLPRQLAMYLCRRYTDDSLTAIAQAFDREHPAVSNAVRSIERRILERAPLRYQVEALSARLDGLEGLEGLTASGEFAGRGDSVMRKGSVHREGGQDTPVYTLHSTDGEILKLTAPIEVATLAALAGKHVELNGRRLFLTTVSGPVLVIDEVVSYHR